MSGVRRYLMVLGAILFVLIGGAIVTKPKPGEMKKEVETAMAAYKKAQAAAPAGLVEDISLPSKISEERDWLLAVSYSAEQLDGKRFACWGAFKVTICNAPD
jgi:hypothetical protein